jgi:hypothetical protein
VARAIGVLPDHAFLIVIASVYIVVTLWLGRHLTFYLDECDFLGRHLGNLTDLLRPHNEHWVTVPFVLYGSLRHIVGTESYAPFLLLLTATQIFTAAGVYWLLIARGRWFAIFAFALLLFLGSGSENQFWAFQVGFVLAGGFGAWALLAADRQRPLAAALLLVAAAASSNIGLAFIPAVAIVIGRRRELAWLTAPVLAFAAWYWFFGRDVEGLKASILFTPERLVLIPGYVLASINHAVAGVTGLGVPAAVALLFGGLGGSAVSIVRGWKPPKLLVAAVVGVIVHFGVIGLGRAELAVLPPRYVTEAAVFFLAGCGSMLPLRIGPSARRLAITVALVLGCVAFTSNLLAMQEGANTQLYWDNTTYRCVPPQ